MTLKATISTRIGRLSGLERGEDFPLPEGTNHLPQPLPLDGTPEDPDVFDLEDRITLHAEGQDAAYVGRRYARLERHLAEVYEGIERLDADSGGDSGETSEGESSIPPEDEV
jgi:hypothetical protein